MTSATTAEGIRMLSRFIRVSRDTRVSIAPVKLGQHVPSVEAAELVPGRALESRSHRGNVQRELVLQHVDVRQHLGFDEQTPEIPRCWPLLELIKRRVINGQRARGHAAQGLCDVRPPQPAHHRTRVHRRVRKVHAKPGQLDRSRSLGSDELVQSCLQPASPAVRSGQELLTAARAAREPWRVSGADRTGDHAFIGAKCEDSDVPAQRTL